MEAVILAGGFGTRLSSKLRDLPKSMAPIGGRPFLAMLLDQLVAAGCERTLLSVGHLRNVIQDAFQDSYLGMPLEYIIEEAPLGTGGAIRLALSQVQIPSAIVLNGDTYLELDLGALSACHASGSRPMTMAVVQVPDTSRYGGVVVEDGIIEGFVEKGRHGPGWINGGIYVLDRDFPWPVELPARFSFETDVLSRMIDLLRPSAFLCNGYFLDIGVPEDLDRAELELAGRRSHPNPPGSA
jgi:D-glycero-alpha-D-manno-heptose 1-phosphate guanylyltransferase